MPHVRCRFGSIFLFRFASQLVGGGQSADRTTLTLSSDGLQNRLEIARSEFACRPEGRQLYTSLQTTASGAPWFTICVRLERERTQVDTPYHSPNAAISGHVCGGLCTSACVLLRGNRQDRGGAGPRSRKYSCRLGI